MNRKRSQSPGLSRRRDHICMACGDLFEEYPALAKEHNGKCPFCFVYRREAEQYTTIIGFSDTTLSTDDLELHMSQGLANNIRKHFYVGDIVLVEYNPGSLCLKAIVKRGRSTR